MPNQPSQLDKDLREDFDDFFNNSLCGFIILSSNGVVEKVNKTFANWMEDSTSAFNGKRVSDLLTIGGKIYYETHLSPLLKMQRFFDEVALELLSNSGKKIPILMNGMEKRDVDGKTLFIRITVFQAKDRRIYEQNLKTEKIALLEILSDEKEFSLLKEQFIAILGHDLRNPLGSVSAAASVLARAELKETEKRLVEIIQKSSVRMSELIVNIMDFARTRLGDGIILNRQITSIEPLLMHVVDEIRTIFPKRIIETHFKFTGEVDIDGGRISQLFSNLLSNAVMHGSSDTAVRVYGDQLNNIFHLSVCNEGYPISAEKQEQIFQPFTRDSTNQSQNGLGLGLYIAQQIAKAHHAKLSVRSDSKETCFMFDMPI